MALCPGTTLNGQQVRIAAGSAPAAAYVLGGIGMFNTVQLAIDTDVVGTNGLFYDNGFALDAAGCLYGTTATAGTDQYQGGLRRSAAGALVYTLGATTQYVNGNPVDANGALACV